jgi:hypothetical protein
VHEVLAIFDQAGLRRNQRSIARYCASGKLDCFREDDESGASGRYYITPESVEWLIGLLRELQARHHHHFAAAQAGAQSPAFFARLAFTI